MIAALYVATGGCYYGLEGCYFSLHPASSANATQVPRSGKKILCRVPREAPRHRASTGRRMAGQQSWPQRREFAAVAGGKSRAGGGQREGIPSSKSRKTSPVSARMAKTKWLQPETQRERGECPAAVAALWTDGLRLRAVASASGRRLRNLRAEERGHEEREAALRRSLPRQQLRARTSMPGMQYDAWLRSGQSRTPASRSDLP